MSKHILLSLSLSLCLLFLPLSLHADPLTGHCGSSIDFTLQTADGVLSLDGTGNMTEYKQYFLVPWTINRASVRTVLFAPGITSVSQNAFYGCANLNHIILPESVTKIGQQAFYGCTSLDTLVLPEALQRVPKSMCYGCSSLEVVTIGANATKIEKSAFYGCTSLQLIDCYLPTPVAVDSSVFFGVPDQCVLCVPAGSKALYQSAPVWSRFCIRERE